MHTIEMVRRGSFKEHMYEPPMHRNIQTGSTETGLEFSLEPEFVMGTESGNMIQPSEPWPRS
jgi:hypothetical protein